MITHQEVAERTGTEIPPHLIAQAEVPVATNWRQGDVYVMKHAAGPKGTGIDISQGAGHKVVAGEADRNSHILNGDGMFYPGQYRRRCGRTRTSGTPASTRPAAAATSWASSGERWRREHSA